MLKLTKTGIGLLTKQYRSVLKRCLIANLCILYPLTSDAQADAMYISTEAGERAQVIKSGNGGNAISFMTDLNSGSIILHNTQHDLSNSYNFVRLSASHDNVGGILELKDRNNNTSYLTPTYFQLNNSGYATGIDFASNVTAGTTNASHLATTGAVNQLLNNYYYTKTEADAEYALLEAAIEDVDDKVEDVDDKVDAVEAKIGSLNETGIAGNDVATQLKYILENGSTGGAGVTLSTLGYIGANTPYLNTTNEAMNFSSNYTIGGNMSTLANQIKTNETNIDNLSSRINSLSSYSGTLDLTDNYAKVIGDVNLQTNQATLVNDGINTKAYATPNKSYTVEITGHNGTWSDRYFRVQVNASNAEEAEILAKEAIVNGWTDSTVVDEGDNRHQNKYMYGTQGYDHPLGIERQVDIETENSAVQAATATVTENNWVVEISVDNNYEPEFIVDASGATEEEALENAKQIALQGFYRYKNANNEDKISNLYFERAYNGSQMDTASSDSWKNWITNSTNTSTDEMTDQYGYGLNGSSLLENVAILDSAIGDLGTTGVSGASVAAQLKLLGEVGSEALGQKIGLWNTTKNGISQTLGEETKIYGYLTAFEYDSENEQYVGTVGDNLTALDTALSLTAKSLDALSHQLYNYYYTKTEADARYALLDTIGDVNYSDEAEDEGSALKNGAEDSPTTVRGALDLLDTKIGSLNETGIAGNDVATQLKYILENGSTGGAGVTLSTLGYIGANTPYLNTTNEAMNFSSNYTIGGNMSTLANQIKTNENSISALNTRVNNLGTYGGTLELTDNYGKIMGDVSTVRNGEQLGAATINVKPYATEAPLKNYRVELTSTQGSYERYYRVQVEATDENAAEELAKNKIAENWQYEGSSYVNRYMYSSKLKNSSQGAGNPVGVGGENDVILMNENIQAAEVSITENNYIVTFQGRHPDGKLAASPHIVGVVANNADDAYTKAKELVKSSIYYIEGHTDSTYGIIRSTSGVEYWKNCVDNSILTSSDYITDETFGNGFVLGNGTVIENIALLDSAIGDLGTTGVSGASVAAQLKLLGEVGSEALGQKIGSWSTTKDSISQTLGEETKNYGYLTAFEYDSENEQYVGTVGDNLTALDAALSLTAKGLDALSHQLYNYYYTFRVDERDEVIEFTKELRSNKKEMSSLDFMPIKSSSDLRISLIKAEDPLTFSTKTRDDSLVLMEVCHA